MTTLKPQFPEGYRAEITDEHDGTGGNMVALYSPSGQLVTKTSGGGWDKAPFWYLAQYARAHAKGVQDAQENK